MIVSDGQKARDRAATIVRGGGVIGFRTDTFYGLGADPFNSAAVLRVKELKGREDNKPILVVISETNQVQRFLESQSNLFALLTKAFWPGPLTLIGAAREDVLAEITAGSETIGLRVPDDEPVVELIRSCGGALTATSANPSGTSPACTAKEVEDYFPMGLDLVVDGGTSRTDRPSTVVDVCSESARLVREGVISKAGISAVLVSVGLGPL